MSPAGAGRRKAAKRAAKRPAKKAARRGTKRPAKKAARRAAKRPAKKAARRATKRPAAARAARGPVFGVVRRAPAAPPVPPAPPPFAGATAGASARDLALFEFVRARVQVHAAIQGMSAASAERPTAPGKWSAREMILHLAYWDRELLKSLEDAYLHGRRAPYTHEDVLRLNPAGVDELRHHDWESAKRLLQTTRERLLEALQSLPEEPAEMWTKAHAVGAIVRILTHHDRHHALALKKARERPGT